MPAFMSRFAGHVLVMQPAGVRQDADGTVTSIPGKRIEFQNGRYETSDPKELKFIRNHRDFNLFIFEEKAQEVV